MARVSARQRGDQAAGEDVALDPVGRRAVALPPVVRDQDRLHAGDARRAPGAGRSSRSRSRTDSRRSPRASRSRLPSCSSPRAGGSPPRGCGTSRPRGYALAGERRLLGGDRQPRHAAADLAPPRTGRSRPSRSRSRVRDLRARQPELLADPPVLAALGLRERLVGAARRRRTSRSSSRRASARRGRCRGRSGRRCCCGRAGSRCAGSAAVAPRAGGASRRAARRLMRRCGAGARAARRGRRCPIRRRVRLADAELAARRDAGGRSASSWIRQPSRRPAPLPKRRSSAAGQPHLERPALEARRALAPGSRPRPARAATSRAACGARRRVRSTLLISSPSPARGRTRACGGTGRA